MFTLSRTDSPGDGAEGAAYAAQLAQISDRMRDRLKPRWAQLGGEASRMIAVAQKLMKEEDDDVRRGSARVNEAVIKTMASLQNLLDNELNGANDPEIRARIEFGKNEHKRIQADSSKCTASELTFGSRRVDCIRVSGNVCYVVEIKPNNSAAIARGQTQMKDGIDAINAALSGKKKRDELTGALEIFRPCFSETSETAKLEPEPRVYEYCPSDGELHKDFVLP